MFNCFDFQGTYGFITDLDGIVIGDYQWRNGQVDVFMY